MTVPDFFIPGAKDPGKSWDLYVQSVGLKSDEAEALYEIGYLHDGDRYEVRVGEPRHVFPRKTGPRGGYRPNAGHRGWSSDIGTVVTAIMRTPTVIYVWSLSPHGGWANPSMVGTGELGKTTSFNA
jgi:hypothetical protein